MNTSLSEPSDPGSSRSKGTDKSSDRGQSISETSAAPVLDIVRLMDVVLDVASFPSPCGSNPLLTNLWINQYMVILILNLHLTQCPFHTLCLYGISVDISLAHFWDLGLLLLLFQLQFLLLGQTFLLNHLFLPG